MLAKWRAMLQGGITPSRLAAGFFRRVRAIPERVAYRRLASPGSENYRKLSACHDRHVGERAFIVGNGPSLADMDLSRLSGEYTFGFSTYDVRTRDIAGQLALEMRKNLLYTSNRTLKRATDLVFFVVMGALSFPLFMLISLGVAIDGGRPNFYSHE